MKYHVIEPEVIVGLGGKTQFLEKEPPFKTVTKLHIQLEDWLGDDIMLNSNCYIATENLKRSLEQSNFTGFQFEEMEVTKDRYFNDNYQLEKPLPKFYWMKINGKKDEQDLFMNNSELNVSESFLSFLRSNFQIKYLVVDPVYDKETDDFIMSLINRDKGLQKP